MRNQHKKQRVQRESGAEPEDPRLFSVELLHHLLWFRLGAAETQGGVLPGWPELEASFNLSAFAVPRGVAGKDSSQLREPALFSTFLLIEASFQTGHAVRVGLVNLELFQFSL